MKCKELKHVLATILIGKDIKDANQNVQAIENIQLTSKFDPTVFKLSVKLNDGTWPIKDVWIPTPDGDPDANWFLDEVCYEIQRHYGTVKDDGHGHKMYSLDSAPLIQEINRLIYDAIAKTNGTTIFVCGVSTQGRKFDGIDDIELRIFDDECAKNTVLYHSTNSELAAIYYRQPQAIPVLAEIVRRTGRPDCILDWSKTFDPATFETGLTLLQSFIESGVETGVLNPIMYRGDLSDDMLNIPEVINYSKKLRLELLRNSEDK